MEKLKPSHSKEALVEHYKKLAVNYDKYFYEQDRAKTRFTLRQISLSPDDQLVDLGGGTGQLTLMLRKSAGLKKPVVCVDPSQDMLDVARQKDGLIAVQSTAEEFLASKPEYPLKVVFMHGSSHHFENLDFVFSRLAEYMPDDGVCFITEYPVKNTLPLFNAAREAYLKVTSRLDILCELIRAKGLKSKMVKGTELGEINMALWYEGLRNRMFSILYNFSDEEIEEGIKEMREQQYNGVESTEVDIAFNGIIVTKN